MEQKTLARIEFRRVFPFLWLFRTFRIALDVRKLLLAVAGLILVAQGNRLIDHFGMVENPPPAARFSLELPGERLPIDAELFFLSNDLENEHGSGGGLDAVAQQREGPDPNVPTDFMLYSYREWIPASSSLFSPLFDEVVGSSAVLINPTTRFAPRIDALCRVLWFLVVWGLVGGAISRMAIHEFVLDERISALAAVGFATRRVLYFFTAPLLPFGGCVAIVLTCALISLVGRIPGVGPWFVALFWFVGLILSVGIAIMLIGLVAGWPLMIAAISTEDSDGFDGFSRAHSYVFDRPWHYLGYILLVMIYGGIAIYFIDWAAGLVTLLTDLSIGLGAGRDTIEQLSNPDNMPAKIHGFWLAFLQYLTFGFRVSFFWSALLIIYLLLRKGVDNTPLKEAFLTPQTEDQERQMALAGMAGVREVVTERSVVNPDDDSAANPTGEQVSDSSEEKPGSEPNT